MPTQIIDNQSFITADQSGQAALTIGTQEPNSVITNCTIAGRGLHWSMKMPGNQGSQFLGCNFLEGKERALDMVQCRDVKFNHCTFGTTGADRAPVTSRWDRSEVTDIGIKGHSTGIVFKDCVMNDLLLGDHSIYDNPTMDGKTVVTLDSCSHPHGLSTPIIVRVLNAQPPIILGDTNVLMLVYWGPVVSIYFWYAGKWIDSRVGQRLY